MNKGKRELARIGVVALLISLLCILPVIADTVPVITHSGVQIGTFSFAILPDKPAYAPGSKITYSFDENPVGSNYNWIYLNYGYILRVYLDPNIKGITVDPGGGDCTVVLHNVYCVNPSPTSYWSGGDVQISGTIDPMTPVGTKITTSGQDSVAIGWGWPPSNIRVQADDTSVVTVNNHPSPPNPPYVPEFPSVILPAAMVIGFLGTVLFIRRAGKN